MNATEIITNYSTWTNPGWAKAIYEECGSFAYCMPIETCRKMIDSSQFLYKVVDVGVLICVVILIVYCESYYRKYRKAQKELEELKCTTKTALK
jgi:hypothetical protein